MEEHLRVTVAEAGAGAVAATEAVAVAETYSFHKSHIQLHAPCSLHHAI
jgi:hypothetical protein